MQLVTIALKLSCLVSIRVCIAHRVYLEIIMVTFRFVL